MSLNFLYILTTEVLELPQMKKLAELLTPEICSGRTISEWQSLILYQEVIKNIFALFALAGMTAMDKGHIIDEYV